MAPTSAIPNVLIMINFEEYDGIFFNTDICHQNVAVIFGKPLSLRDSFIIHLLYKMPLDTDNPYMTYV